MRVFMIWDRFAREFWRDLSNGSEKWHNRESAEDALNRWYGNAFRSSWFGDHFVIVEITDEPQPVMVGL